MTEQEITPEEEVAPSPEEIEAIEARQEIEEEAKKYGWRPKEEFDFEPDNWVDADRFMEFPQTQNKKLSDQMRELKEAVSAKDEEIEKVRQGAIQATRKIDGIIQQNVEQRLAAIKAEQELAVENADTERFKALEGQKEQVLNSQPASYPEIDEYRSKNDWAKNPVIWGQAVSIVESNPDIMFRPAREQLEYAEGQIKLMYPAYFEGQPAQAGAQTGGAPSKPSSKVDPGGLGGVFKSGNSAADLPPEARQAGNDFVSEGVFKSLDDYAKSYFAESK